MTKNALRQETCINIKAIALDVDGVLTDGGIWWGANGEESRRFSFRDIMGVSLAHRNGLMTTLISGENSSIIHRFAANMSIKEVFTGCRDKASTLREFAARNQLELCQVSFMGDDVNDIAAMDIAGLSAAPANAHATVRKRATFVTKNTAGKGAVRELIDALLIAHGTAIRQRDNAKTI